MENVYAYDAWENRVVSQEMNIDGECSVLPICLRGGESRIIVVGSRDQLGEDIRTEGEKRTLQQGWYVSTCKSINYPDGFTEEKELDSFGDYGKKDKKFSGYIAYRTKVQKQEGKKVILEITDAGEDVEVFVNGTSAGIQVLPPFRYDITELMTKDVNEIRIEVATTLERERNADKKNWKPTGILGEVNLYLS